MASNQVKKELRNCKIDLSRRVLVTQLLQDYLVTYDELQALLAEHIAEERQKGNTFDLWYMVFGVEKATQREVYTIVHGIENRDELLATLNNPTSSIYSAELEKAAPDTPIEFMPLSRCALKLRSLTKRIRIKTAKENTAPACTAAAVKTEPQPAAKKGGIAGMLSKGAGDTSKKAAGETNASPQPTSAKTEQEATPAAAEKVQETKPPAAKPAKEKKSPTTKAEQQKKSPVDKDKKHAVAKHGIGNFFSAVSATKTPPKAEEAPAKTEEVAPVQSDGVFRKPAAKLTPQEHREKMLRKLSEQLLCKERVLDSFEMDSSSDEEEKELDALKREIIVSDDDDEEPKGANKRRRIVDSDEEIDGDATEPQQKHEKREMPLTEREKSKAYLDEDGFVVTVKAPRIKARSPRKPLVAKAPEKVAPAAPVPAPKSKQGSIMSFFQKK